jgi:hypothetical protein
LIPDEIIEVFNSPNPSSRTMALGSTQPLTEMNIWNLPGGKGRPARKADNLTAVCEPIVYKIWEPRRLTILRASTARYRDSFTFSLPFLEAKQNILNLSGTIICHISSVFNFFMKAVFVCYCRFQIFNVASFPKEFTSCW